MKTNRILYPRFSHWIAVVALGVGAASCRAQGVRLELNAADIAPSSNAVTRQDWGTPVVFLNNSNYTKDPTNGGFAEWKFETPQPAGWWHGVAKSTIKYKQYANREIAFALISDKAKTAVPFAPHNYRGGPNEDLETFEFRVYAPAPFSAVRYQPTTDLYRWNETWPLSKLTLEQKTPDMLTTEDAIALDVPVQDGVASLPINSLPMGSFWLSGVVNKPGNITVKSENGKSVNFPLSGDQYGRPLPQTRYFYLNSPLTQILVEPKNGVSKLNIQHKRGGKYNPPDLPDKQPLISLFDEKKPQTATLELIGKDLDGTAPTFAAFPFGKKIAIVTTWDDGAPEDMRLAQIFQKHGFHASFFVNNNSRMMPDIAKLEAMGMEIGSHGYGHPFLYQITPAEADFHMIEQRRSLEAKLGHPVVAMAYPNGYSTAYDETGDYVLTAVKKAGYLSGRTTAIADVNINNMGDLLKLNTNGFFGYGQKLVENYEKRRDTEGEIFHFWGHSWQVGKTDDKWNECEKLITNFADNPEAWYAPQGYLSVWHWLRTNTKMEVATKGASSVKVTLTRPTLHSWLASRVPVAIKVPAGVTHVKWQGKTLDVKNGTVDLPWGGM